MLSRSVRTLLISTLGIALAVGGSAFGSTATATAAPAAAADPVTGVQVLAAEGANSGLALGDLHWRDGKVYAVRTSTEPMDIAEYPASGPTASAPTRQTVVPGEWGAGGTWWQGDLPAFEVAPDGSFYVRAPFRNESTDPALGWGVGHLQTDGTMTPTEVPPAGQTYTGELAGASESIVMDPDGSGLIIGGARQKSFGGSGGTSYGVAAEIPLPLPADQQAGAELIASADGWDPNDSATYHKPPFLPGNGVDVRTLANLGTILDVDAKGPYIYLRESWFIHRVDRRTNEITTICCRQPAGWDEPPLVEGGAVMDAHIELQAGPVADREGNLFVAVGQAHQAGGGPAEIWEIRNDATLHKVAGQAAGGDPAVTGADPLTVRLGEVGDLDLDPEGNLYVTSNDGFYEPKRILMLPEVAAADTAPGAPRDLVVTRGHASLDVAWAAPVDDGGQPVLDYTVRAHPSGATGTDGDVVVTVTSSTARVTGLANGTSYDVSVVATNSRGSGPAVTSTATPAAYAASLTASPAEVAAGEVVQLDASASHVPDGSSFAFFCDGRFLVQAPASGRTAACTYPRGSNDQGYGARVVVTGPDGATWSATDDVQVSDPAGTVEGSSGFDGSTGNVEVVAGADGSLTSTTCAAGATGATCVDVTGARIVLAAAQGTLRPGSRVRIHQGDEAVLQQELGSDVEVQGGFAVTWVDSQDRKYDLAKPLVVTVTPTAAGADAAPRAQLSAQRAAGWDAGMLFTQWGQSFISGVTSIANTIGSGLEFLGNRISQLWAAAPQSTTLPNGSVTNAVYQCSSFLVITGAKSYRCEGVLTELRDVPTARISALDAGGRVVSAGGANVVAAGGMNVVSAGGANVVSAGGANLSVQLAGNSVISAGGANVVSAGGANVVSAGGANVVSAGGGNVISAGGANILSMALTRDPGFVFAAPQDPTPPNAAVTLDPAPPASGVHPYGTVVRVRLTGTPAGTKSIQRVTYEVTGAQTTAHTMVAGHEAELTIAGSGTSTLAYGAADDQLAESSPGELAVTIAAPAAPSAPGAPSGVAGPEHDSIRFSWSAPTEHGDLPITGYALEVTDHGLATDGTGAQPLRTVEVTEAVADVADLLPGHTYTAVVRAVSEAGASDASAASADVVTADAPEAPYGLVPTAGDGSVTLTWSAPEQDGGLPVSEYSVSRGPSAEGPFAEIGSSPTTSFTDTDVTDAVTYYYVVRARNHVGTSGPSSVVSATPDAVVQQQTVTFTAPGALTYGAGPRALAATASSGLPVQLTSLDTGVCTVAGATLRVVGAGTCRVEAAQAGNDGWSAAPPVQRSIVVGRAALKVTPSAASMVRGGKAPAVAPVYGGLVAGDSPYDLRTPATCRAVARKKRSTCAGATSSNYAISYATARLAVRKRGAAIVSPALVHALAGRAVSVQVSVDGVRGAVIRWKGRLPSGIKARSTKRGTKLRFTGSPTTSGTFRVTINARGKGGKARQALTIRVW